MSVSLVEQPPNLVLGGHHSADDRNSIVQSGVQLVAGTMTLNVVECEGFHFSLGIDVGHGRDLGTEDDFRVVREEIQLKINCLKFQNVLSGERLNNVAEQISRGSTDTSYLK
jgi:hypothetical protein